MKTKKIIFPLAALLLIITLSTSTAFSQKRDFTERVKTLVNRVIGFPEFASAEKVKGVAVVNYSIEANGTVTINEIEASDNRFSIYLEKKMSQITIKGLHNRTMDKEIKCKYIFK